MNQAEVVHAAWANRNETGLSLQQAAEFDTKDSLILEAELKNYEHSANSNGCGPSLVKLGKRKQHREREVAERSGQDILGFGVQEPSYSLNDKEERKKGPYYFCNVSKTTGSCKKCIKEYENFSIKKN